MSTVPSPSEPRVYPLAAPPADHRFTLGLVFDVIKVLSGYGYPPITSGGDLVALQQCLFGFLYGPPGARPLAGVEVSDCCGRLGDDPHKNFCPEYRPSAAAQVSEAGHLPERLDRDRDGVHFHPHAAGCGRAGGCPLMAGHDGECLPLGGQR